MRKVRRIEDKEKGGRIGRSEPAYERRRRVETWERT